jgi:hypothetical protein
MVAEEFEHMSDPPSDPLSNPDIDWPAATIAFEQAALEYVTEMVKHPPRDDDIERERAGDMTYRILRAAFGKDEI